MNEESPDQQQAAGGASPERADERAAVFVDYQNLHVLLARQLGGSAHPADYVEAMLDELQRYLADRDYKQTALINAYADFSQLSGDGQAIQQSLYLIGAEPHFAPSTLQGNASEIQLCIDAVNVLHDRPDIRSFALLTGDRSYLPLVQQCKRNGHETFVAALHPPAQDDFPNDEEDFFLDARNLLTSDLRRQLEQSSSQQPQQRRRSAPQTREDASYERVHDPKIRRTLEIIEEYFGQYDEVYLTPLLRKLSELLGASADPKSIISSLEAAGAIWLEKRRGTPHDYTVLLVDEEHPDVEEVHAEFYDTSASGDDAPTPPADQEDGDPSYGDFNESNYAAELDRYEDDEAVPSSAPRSPQEKPDAPSS
jgi:hypothetical protein